MSKPTVIAAFGMLLLAFCCRTVAQDDESGPALTSDDYALILRVPEYKKNAEITRDAKVSVEGRNISVDSTGLAGNEIALKGVQEKGKIKMYVSDIERQGIVTLHFIGNVSNPSRAGGKVFFIKDGKVEGEGEWELKKK